MKKLRVLLLSSEVAPFAKVGGLADVAGALPRELAKQGVDIRVGLPLYKQIRTAYADKLEFLRWDQVKLGWRSLYCGVFKLVEAGVTYYFIDNEYYFGHDNIYLDYSFDVERYVFFQRAILDNLMKSIDFIPDVIHCNDWQTGMVPCLLEAHFKPNGFYTDIKTVFTIHNLRYQGIHGHDRVADLCDLSAQYLNNYGALKDGVPNFMKAGIVYANRVTTVSPTYLEEIKTAYYGEGLDNVIRSFSYKTLGIINGMDDLEYDPNHDKYIAESYNKETLSTNKPKCKQQLQEKLGLEVNPDVMVIGMVSRLVYQKGIDLVFHVLNEIMKLPVQLVILGTGDLQYEDALKQAAKQYPGRMCSYILHDNAVAHQIYAGSDVILVPSIFEPCGLTQMIAMKYGSLPVVRETGGLVDTVRPYNQYTGEGNGFSFSHINAHELLEVIERAAHLYTTDKTVWAHLVENALKEDFSWKESAKKYIAIYEELVQNTNDTVGTNLENEYQV